MKIKEKLKEKYQQYVLNNSKDPYSKGVVTYAERWANLMEEEIAKGEVLEKIANSTSHTADTEGITGFMYGCAVQSLAHFWVYGELLRTWHNSLYGIKSDKGVVNPAILTVKG